MNQGEPTSRAANLAERILHEVSSAKQDWRVVAVCARELAELAKREAASARRAP